MGINSILITVQATAAILFSLFLMLPPASYVGSWKTVEEEYIRILSTLDVFNKVAGRLQNNRALR